MTRLFTQRLILERPADRIAGRLLAWQQDRELRYLSDAEDREPDAEDIDATLARWNRPDRDDLHVFAVVARANLEPIGYLQVAMVDRFHRSCELGIILGERRAWGKGLGGEAIEAALGYCFLDLDLHRVGAEIFAINPRSVRLFERCGFVREGVLRDKVVKEVAGALRPVDVYLYGLLRREWRPTEAIDAETPRAPLSR